MDLDAFEDIVFETIKELPPEFSKAMDNVGIVVELWPTEDEMRSIRAHPGTLLFGLYRGIPRTKRMSSYSALPDKIIIYAGPILMISKTLDEAKTQIRKTVLHEIGHHFGMSEESIRRAQESV
jgi:predicted Zn-dependent protease with MMP-like domain